MWLKLPGPYFHPMSEEAGGLFVLPTCRGSEWMPGIYMPGPEGSPQKVLNFACAEHAAESLSNLFIVWSRNRNALYLVPQGNTWILDPALKEMPKEAK